MKVPIPDPHTAIPVASDLCFSKYIETQTIAGRYIKPKPKPVQTPVKRRNKDISVMQKLATRCRTMMIILRGGTIEQLTFILSEVRAASAVTNPGRGSRQPHTEQL